MELHYNVTGEKRKELVGVISELLKMKAVYMKMPTCAYVIDNITVEKDGTVVWDERTDQDTIEAVIIALAAAGFTAEKEEQPHDVALLNEAMAMHHNKLLPLAVVPVLPLGDARPTDVPCPTRWAVS